MEPDALVALFDACATAQEEALTPLVGEERRRRTDVADQYGLDLVTDAAILPLLHEARLRVLSEESGWTGDAGAPVTVVLDPVDGSTNCARGIPFWGISLSALDGDGLLCGLVTNGATDQRYHAVRGEGAWCDGEPLRAAGTERIADSLVSVTGLPPRALGWKQARQLGSTALSLCGVAAGGIDALADFVNAQKPWDYLGGLLVAREAGATVLDLQGRELVVADGSVTRRLVAAATPALADELARELTSQETS